MNAPKWLRPYLPNTSTRLALVSRDMPEAAHWPIRLTQIVGGKTWSISFTHVLTPEPIPTPRFTPPGSTDETGAMTQRVADWEKFVRRAMGGGS